MTFLSTFLSISHKKSNGTVFEVRLNKNKIGGKYEHYKVQQKQ